jgi:DnaJ-class molecular chaperone
MKMSMQDPYAVLGVRRNAGPDEIKAAWRTMAKAVHPDQNRDDPHAAARFAEAGRAYEVLKDPRMRNRYDQARRDADLRRMEEMKRRADGKRTTEQPVGPETAEEAVSRIFGADADAAPASRPAPSPRAASSQTQPPQAQGSQAQGSQAQGSQAQGSQAQGPQAQAAQAQTSQASASGVSGTEPQDPTGEQPQPQAPGILSRAAAPAAELVSQLFRRILPVQPSIAGETGERPERPPEKLAEKSAADRIPDLVCEAAVTVEDLFRGRRVSATLPDGQTLKVALPPGTTDGSTIRLREQGYRQGTARGDALVGIRVTRHPHFRVEGLDLSTTLSIALHDAVLGGVAKVTTLTGVLPVTVPPWSGPDRQIRLKGQGLPTTDGGRGDLLVELSLTLGDRPDPKLVDLLRSQREGLVL